MRKRQTNEMRKDRVNRNWPIHAQQVVDVFRAFALEAKADGVHLFVNEPEWIEWSSLERSNRIGEFVLGATTVSLRFASEHTGEGMLTRTTETEKTRLDLEHGAELIIHHTPSDGLVQVFFGYPSSSVDGKAKEPLLFKHTYNTDLITNDWVANLAPPFLTFNRFFSRLEHPSYTDSWRVRWWRFVDVRNRRGHLDSFQHFLTTWELVLLAGILAIPGVTFVQWLLAML